MKASRRWQYRFIPVIAWLTVFGLAYKYKMPLLLLAALVAEIGIYLLSMTRRLGTLKREHTANQRHLDEAIKH